MHSNPIIPKTLEDEEDYNAINNIIPHLSNFCKGTALFYLRSYDIKNNRTIFQYGFLVRNLFTLKFVLNVFFRIVQFQFFHKNIPHLIARTFIKNFPY